MFSWLSQVTPCSAALLLLLGGAVWPGQWILAVELTADARSPWLVLITASFGLQAPSASAAALLWVLHKLRAEPWVLHSKMLFSEATGGRGRNRKTLL